MDRTLKPSCSRASENQDPKLESKPSKRGLPLNEILRESNSVFERKQELANEKLGMTVFPSMPLINTSSTRMEQPNIKYSAQFSRTLMVGKDLLDETDICRGGDDARTIYKALLSYQIQSLNSLQRCVWPHIIRGRDCTIIGGTNAKKGKSLAYLAPIAQLCLSNSPNAIRVKENVPKPVGPIGLILCGSSKSCDKVGGMLSTLVLGTNITVVIVGDLSDTTLKKNLRGDTDFVITTPKGAENLFNVNFEKFRFERLRFLVVDDFQLICRYAMEPFKFLIEKIHHSRSRQHEPGPLQTIFCGTEWNDIVASATLNICNDAVIFIESSMASIQYGDIHSRVHYFAEKSEKMFAVQRLCKEVPESRIIVFCADPLTAGDICVQLVRNCYITNTHTLLGDANVEQIRQLKRRWDMAVNEKIVLVISDSFMKDLQIHDAEYIIHYDLPLQGKKEAFADRHMLMWDNFPIVTDYSVRGDDALRSKIRLESHVFITNRDNEFEKIMQKLHGIGVDIPEKLLQYAQEQAKKRNFKKDFCKDFKAYGKCLNVVPCNLRHTFTKDDFAQDPTLPKIGRVQVLLVNMIDITVYRGKLISYHDVAGDKKINVIRFANQERKLQADLDKHFGKPEKAINCRDLKVGDYCVVQEPGTGSELIYRRGRVDSILGENSENPQIRVFLIDCGNFLVRTTKQIFVLPDTLGVESVKPLCVTVYLAGIKPFGNESTFSPNVARVISENNILGSTFTGKIVLSIGNDVWVNSFQEHKKGVNGEWIPIRNLRVELVRTLNCGEWNPQHMDLLYDSCEGDADVNCDRYRVIDFVDKDLDTVFFPKGGKVEWAFLPSHLNTEKGILKTDVWCSFYPSIRQIYVQRGDRIETLEKLLNAMDDDIKQMTQDKYNKYASIFEDYYEVGLPVAVLEREDKAWNRGMIVNKEIVDEKPYFDVFYVDNGDMAFEVSMKEMFPLKTEYVTKLPFQAIRIGCAHVLPKEGESDFGKSFYNATKDYFIKDGISQLLEVVVKEKLDSHVMHGVKLCNVYDSLIMDPHTGEEIGKILEAKSLAKIDPDVLPAIAAWKQACLKQYNKVIDEAMAPDEDSDTDDLEGFLNDDDFDVCLGLDSNDAEENGRMAASILADFGILEPVMNAVSKLPHPSSKLAIAGKEVKKPTAPPVPKAKEVKSPSLSSALEELVLTNPASAQLLKPNVEWKQTPNEIIIWIHIVDLTDYKIEVNKSTTNDRVIFTSKEPEGYGFELELVGKVLPNITETRNGQYVTIKMRKLCRKIFWPYLLEGNRKCRWLKRRVDEYTLDGEEEEKGYTSEEEEDTPALEMLKQTGTKIDYSLPGGYDSDSGDSEPGLRDELLSSDDEEVGAYEED